jgi:carboxylesterase
MYDTGANVLILRAPHHGLANAQGDGVGGVGKVGSLSAQELRDFADDAVDIAAGLGDEVDVLGLSMGGVLALWTGEFRDDVDRVVAVAPAVSIPRVPHFLTTAFVNVGNRLPNFSLSSPGVKLDHAYAGESTGALAAMFLLARAVGNEIPGSTAAAREVTVVLNPDDNQVDNGEVKDLVGRWSDADGTVDVVEFPATGLPHDVIDPGQPAGDVDTVYPILLELLAGDEPAS